MSPTPARPPPALPDDVVEEVLARFPPDDPALLVRTALVCKDWCRLLSGPGFRRRFRRFHRKPPLLFYIYHCATLIYYKPTSSFRPLHPASPDWNILNARHGRFLVLNVTSPAPSMEAEFIVWDPTTDEQHRLPMPPFEYTSWNAALLCAAAGCDHSDCPWGPFLVVFVFARSSEEGMMSACLGAWREPISVHHDGPCDMRVRWPNALVRNAIYFGCHIKTGVLEYDLGKQELSMVGLPPLTYWTHFVLMTAEDGGLGFASVQGSKLCLWSRVAGGPGGSATWVQQRAIELDNVLPVRDPSMSPNVYTVAVAGELGVVFIWADGELFTIDLRSGQIEKVGNGISGSGFVPYTNFYTPALGVTFTGEEAKADASSASKI
ncbi:hypothetical protein SETIT_2G074200v2 [Setaria italica]|uniref:Uncharacterized protein n=1 Tax=Setaria italica TaxID=4555 RepID=A0A368PVZ7_SETIT|nr:hypothetical protein SETIT_2G074200v2 [Setaria italica]